MSSRRSAIGIAIAAIALGMASSAAADPLREFIDAVTRTLSPETPGTPREEFSDKPRELAAEPTSPQDITPPAAEAQPIKEQPSPQPPTVAPIAPAQPNAGAIGQGAAEAETPGSSTPQSFDTPEPLPSTPVEAVERVSRHLHSVEAMKGRFVLIEDGGQGLSGTVEYRRAGYLRMGVGASDDVWLLVDGGIATVVDRSSQRTSFPVDRTPLRRFFGSVDLARGAKIARASVSDDGMVLVRLEDAQAEDENAWVIDILFDALGDRISRLTIATPGGRRIAVHLSELEITMRDQGDNADGADDRR